MIGDIIQPTHLLFILVVALLVLGPKRLPEVGRQLGKGMRDFRGAMSGLEEHTTGLMTTPPPPPPVPVAQAPETAVPVASTPAAAVSVPADAVQAEAATSPPPPVATLAQDIGLPSDSAADAVGTQPTT